MPTVAGATRTLLVGLAAVLLGLATSSLGTAAPAITSVSASPDGIEIEGQELPEAPYTYVLLGTRFPGQIEGSLEGPEVAIAERSATRIVIRFDPISLGRWDRYVHQVHLIGDEASVEFDLPEPLYVPSAFEDFPPIPASDDGPTVTSISAPGPDSVAVAGRDLDLLPNDQITFFRGATADGPFDTRWIQNRGEGSRSSFVADWSRTHLLIHYSPGLISESRWIGAFALGGEPDSPVVTLPEPVYIPTIPPPPADTTPPSIDLVSPGDGTTVGVDEPLSAEWTCADDSAIVVQCSGVVLETGADVVGTPTVPADRRRLPTNEAGTFTLQVTARDEAGNETIRSAGYTVVAFADDDGDGIENLIDTGTGFADDGDPPTVGAIVDRAGLDVRVADATAPDGVTVTIGPGGATDRATLQVCGFTVRLYAGSTATLTCGSITVATETGLVEVLSPNGAQATSVPPGATARFADDTRGGYTVEQLTGSPLRVFVGFESPVDNGGVLNEVKAGRAVPLKWRVLSGAGAPVTDIASATVTARTIPCAVGQPTDAVEETLPDGSGLTNHGNGRYSVNWKSPSSYAGTCKLLRVDLGDGLSQTALFRFTR